MTSKDLLEIKRRFTKDNCTITQMHGCYVNSEKSKVSVFSVKNFLNLDDEEFFKYLDIAKKVLSGKLGNNNIPLEFPTCEESNGGRQQFLMGIRACHLENDDLVNRLYDRIIETYDNPGNYLILLFHDSYDVICKTSDNNKLDESEEIFEYILCAICPVELSKPALGYRQDENRIAPRIRDWVVKAPETGFMFPAFSDRSTDIHSVVMYTKNAKEPHEEFAEEIFGCNMTMTSEQKREEFSDILLNAIGQNTDSAEQTYIEIQTALNTVIENNQIADDDKSSNELTPDIIKEIMSDAGLNTEQVDIIEEKCKKILPDQTKIEEIIDTKAIKESEKMQYVNELKSLLMQAADVVTTLKGADDPLVIEIKKII